MAGSQVLAGQSSAVNNGQLVPWYRGGNYFPRPVRANGPGGISSGRSANPAYPPQSAGPGFAGLGTVGTTGSSQAGQDAAASPFSPFRSPVPWLIAFLIVSWLLMRYVHHGY